MAGYSGTPLVKKLGIRPGMRVVFLDAPDGFAATLGPLPEPVIESRSIDAAVPIHLAVAFCRARPGLDEVLGTVPDALTDDGVLWLAWPKKAAKVATDVSESVVREAGLDSGMVDVKVCAIDETWSGLKFVFRLEDRPGRSARRTTGKRDAP